MNTILIEDMSEADASTKAYQSPYQSPYQSCQSPYQSLSTPINSKTQRAERHELSVFHTSRPTKMAAQNHGWSLLNCCYVSFIIFTIVAISCGGYYFNKSIRRESPTSFQSVGAATTEIIAINKLNRDYLANHHYRLISDDDEGSGDDNDYEDDNENENNNDNTEAQKTLKLKTRLTATTSSGLYFPVEENYEKRSKLEISDVVGDVYIGK
jgi:hypothetical protein